MKSSNPRNTEIFAEDNPVDVAKNRLCSRCRVAFESSWSGERICRHCKDSIAWRKDEPFRRHQFGGRKRTSK